MYQGEHSIQYHKLDLTGRVEEGIGGRIVLLCNEYPISGTGRNAEDALQSLLRCFRLHAEAQAAVKGIDMTLLDTVASPLEFHIAMPYPSRGEMPRESIAPVR